MPRIYSILGIFCNYFNIDFFLFIKDNIIWGSVNYTRYIMYNKPFNNYKKEKIDLYGCGK